MSRPGSKLLLLLVVIVLLLVVIVLLLLLVIVLLLLVVIVLRCARVSKGAGRWNSGRENWTQREGWQQQL